MHVRPTKADTHSKTSRKTSCKTSSDQRGTSTVRLLLTIAAGLAFLALALAVPVGMAASGKAPAHTAGLAAPPQSPPVPASPNQPAVESPGRPAASERGASLSPSALLADPIVNGGFETGDLTGWTTSGSAAHVEALQATNFNPNIAPPDGSYFALLCNGPGAVNGTPQGNLDGNLLGSQAYDTSFLSQILTLTDRDVPATLIFDWSFLTSEGTRAPDPYDDFFRVRLNSDIILSGSKPGGSSPFPDVALTEPAATVSSSGSTNGCQFVQGRTGFGTFRKLITDPGTYTLEFLVADEGDNNIDSGLLIDNVRLVPEIDLVITKTATPDPAIAGDPLIYTISVTNDGTGRAQDVVVTDTLPAEVDFITHTLPIFADPTQPQGCTFSSGSGPAGEDQLFCYIGDMLGGTTRTFEIETDVHPDAVANGSVGLKNTAVVDSVTPDRNLRNNTVILETILQDRADLRVVKLSKPDTTVRAGDPFTYTIFVENLGPSYARAITLTDDILTSGNFTVTRIIQDPTRTDLCTPMAPPAQSAGPGPNIITCELTDPLEPFGRPGGTGRWILQVEVTADQAQDVNNRVQVSTQDDAQTGLPGTPDPDLSNNLAEDFISVSATSNLTLTKIGVDPIDGDFDVLAGNTISWTITVRNEGPSTAENVKLFDVLPRDVVEGSVFARDLRPGRAGQCELGTPGSPSEPLVCQLGNLLVGEIATVTIQADVNPSFVADQPNTDFADFLPNDAFLTSDTFDPDTRNNVVFDAFVKILAQADLHATKIDQPDPVRAGDPLNYTITISNTGPSTAEDVLLVDQLPAGLTFQSVQVLNGIGGEKCQFSAGPRKVSCSLGDLPPSPPTVTVLIDTLVNTDTPAGPLTNRVDVTSVTSDTVLANNTNITATTTISTEADLDIIESVIDEPDPVVAGERLTYHIHVLNHGPSEAPTPVITNTLTFSGTPAGSGFVSFAGATELCTQIGADQIQCDLQDTLAAGEEHSFDLFVDIAPAFKGVVTNTATVDSVVFDPVTENNVFVQDTRVIDVADLRITKIGDPDAIVVAGEPLTYSITVDNLGPSDARNLVITDTLDPKVTFNYADPMQTSGPNPLVWVTDTLAAGDRITVTVVVTANQDIGQPFDPLSNRVEVSSSADDPDVTNNAATLFTDPTAFSDLEVTKFAIGEVARVPGPGFDLVPDRVTAGLSLTYTLTITNHGPSDAENTVLRDRLPPGIVVTSATSNQGACDTGTPGDPSDKLICGLNTVPVGDSVIVTVTADVDPALFDGTILENDALALSDHFDPDNSNNYVTNLTLMERGVADLAVLKTDRPDFVIAGTQLEYTLVISNAGPSVARGVILHDELPDELIALDVYIINPSDVERDRRPREVFPTVCDFRTTPANVIDCSLGDMAVGKVITAVVTTFVKTDVPDSTTITNTAEVFSHTADPIVDNDTEDEDTLILTQADLKIEKMSKPEKVFAGEQKKYTIWVENLGPSDALTVTVTDTLPISLTYEIDTDKCLVVGTAPDVLRCRFGRQIGSQFIFEPLKPGQSWHFDVWALVDPALPPGTIITNTAVITGNTTLGDPNLVNNTATSKNLVLQKADLKITKFGKMDKEVRAGDILTYTVIVDNLGPSYAGIAGRDPVTGNVAIKDVLQSSREYDVIDITTDRDAFCTGIPGPAPQVITATVWPPPEAPPPFEVLPPTGVDNIDERLELDCTLLDPLEVLSADGPPNSGRWILTMRVRAPETQDINNVAVAVSDAFDPDRSNNQAFVEHDITDVSDLEITKAEVGEVQVDGQPGGTVTLVDDAVTAGRSLTYTLTITNHGPSTAENVVLQDRLPRGIVVTGLETSQGDCDTGTPGIPQDKFTCGIGTLAPDASATVTITADVDPSLPDGTILENDALTFSDIFDPTNENNFATNLTNVSAWADLALSKNARGDNVVAYDEELQKFIKEQRDSEVTAGELLQYTLVVTNTGPSDAVNVVITDTLPLPAGPIATVHFVSADGAACRQDPVDRNQLTCELGTLAVGATRTVHILVLVDPAAAGPTNSDTITNVARVFSDTADPFDGPPPAGSGDNNGASNTTAVNAVADIFTLKVDVPAEPRLNKAFEPDLAIAGEEHRYKITFGNDGPSVARAVVVTDTLDIKQLDILGETFVRCEPVDPDDLVTCTEAGGIVTVQALRVRNERIISSGSGTLNPGDEFSFYLITRVDSGYVLDADDLIAEDTSRISSSTTDVRTQNNRDTEQTQITAEADLTIDKIDSMLFLMGDPVVAGGTITYTITVDNLGPSDAAEVLLTDWLPAEGLILDPTQITVLLNGVELTDCLDDLDPPTDVCFVRDDGRIQVILGNDPNNEGTNEVGRMNAGSTEVVTIVVQVGGDAVPGELVDMARVETRRNDEMWPPAPEAPVPGIDGGPRTPTPDPDPSNDKATESTLVVAPSITIDKTVSLDGTCPGTNHVAIGFIGAPVTYCYEITNTGDTYLDFVTVTDTVQTRSGPFVIFNQVYRANPEGDQGVPLAPGDSFIITNTEPDLDILIDCNDRPDTAQVSAVPVNRGRTELNVPVVTDEDSAVVETPCKGVDWRLQLPALNTFECETWIQVQNVGNQDTQAMVVLWGEPGACPPQSFGPLKVECTGLLRPGSAWTLTNPFLPPGAQSGIVYSLNATDIVTDRDGNEYVFADLACLELFGLIRQDHQRWLAFDRAYRERGTFYGPLGDGGQQLVLDFGAHQGEPLAVTVNRSCPDPVDPNVVSSASYAGISTDREGIRDPYAGQFAYYAPLVWADFFGMNSVIHIQNSGEKCTSVELWFQRQGDCIRPVVWDILQLAPGESYPFDPNVVVGPNWQGSVWLRASQPLGMVVDTLGANHFGSYHGVPADVFIDGGSSDFSLGTQVNYAPLIYRENQGWETSIQVQNLSSTHNAKVKVTFLDNSGGVINTVVDWICPRGSQTFFLPVIAGLPGNWVGSARIESQDWFSPGDPAIDSPRILSVVMLEKYTDPAKVARQEAVVYNALQEMGSFDWQVGPGPATGFSGSDVLGIPLAAKGNRGVTSEVAVQNLNPSPGFTDFAIFIYDQNGIIDHVCEKLNEKQVEYIDLDEWGVIRPGFLGSLVISSTFSDQRGGAALGAVAVERVGRTLSQPDLPGDESKAFEAFPLYNRFLKEKPPNCPGQP